MNVSVEKLIFPEFIEPKFHVNFRVIRRSTQDDNSTNCKSYDTICWKIENEKLVKIRKENIGILFDSESYIVQCFFDLKIESQIVNESLVYYWKGQHAIKGYTPLPSELEEQCPVERIVQWSEPALFYHGFQKNIVFTGKEQEFDFSTPHLLLARGELVDEIHFYEVPCKKASLRSRASFLLVVPEKKSFLYWHGSQTSFEQRQKIVNLCQPHNYLKEFQNSWSNFLTHEEEENEETNLFLDVVEDDNSDYTHIKLKTSVTPKLFYLNTITGTFLATEVEYPLRAQSEIASFPFLQSHLYTAVQPALFLLDNYTELWLWEGIKTTYSDNKAFEEELNLAKELQQCYAEAKKNLTAENLKCFHIHANQEPQEFKNIFPFWVES